MGIECGIEPEPRGVAGVMPLLQLLLAQDIRKPFHGEASEDDLNLRLRASGEH